MAKLRTFIIACFCLLFSFTSQTLAGQDPSIKQLETRLEQAKRLPDGAEKQSLVDTYQQTINLLNSSHEYVKQGRQYQQLMEDYPYKASDLRSKIKDFKPSDYPTADAWSRKRLEQELALRVSQQLELKKQSSTIQGQLNKTESQLSGFNQNIDSYRKSLTTTQQKLDQLQFSSGNDKLSQAVQIKTQVQQTALNNQIQMLELEQLSASNRSELSRLALELISLESKALDSYIIELQKQLNLKRREESEAAIAKGQAITKDKEITSPLLQKAIDHNNDLSRQLANLTDKIENTLSTQDDVISKLDEIDYAVSNIKEQVEWLKVSSAFGENLRNRLKQLPTSPPLQPVEEAIVQTRLNKYKYQQERDQLKNFEQELKALQKQSKQPLNLAQKETLSQLLTVRQGLLTQLLSISETYIYEQAKLKVAYSRMNAKLGDIQEVAVQYLFWVPNVKAIDTVFPMELGLALAWSFSPENWLQIPRAFYEIIGNLLFLYLIGAALLLYLWYFANHFFTPYLARTAGKVGNVTKDKYIYTFNNLLLSLLLALPLPTLMYAISQILVAAWNFPFAQNLGVLLAYLSRLVLFFMIIKNLCRPNGLFTAHFKWQPERVKRVYSYIRTLFFIGLPLHAVYLFSYQYQELHIYSTLGRLAFCGQNLLLAWFYWSLYKEKLPLTYKNSERKDPHLLHHVLWPLLALAQIIGLGLTLFGYFYTANSLLNQIEFSVMLGLGFLLTYYLIHRWMFLQKRRLAFDRAKARRAEILAERQKEEGEDITSSEAQLDNIEEPIIDLETISAQSLGLLRTVLSLSFTMSLIFVWSQIYTAFSFLDAVTIWNVSGSSNGVSTLDPISLKDMLFALFTLTISVVVVKNLPGALELLVLQHLDLTPGTGFAITTITKYMVIIIGILTGAGFLGIDWSKTQWLVAALTVGLGFGLQEIFANFVSGLIILFEKPIRIGDTVTIRDLTGTIAKIKTRATTLVDWDKREIIVPNKAFITEDFINWSLSDPITRVITRVGVAYGSDTYKVTQLLMEATEQCSLVLKTPLPEVFFVGFNNSTLEFEIRAYVNDMGHRMPMTHELHCAINRTFEENKITIAFPQMDIHVRRN